MEVSPMTVHRTLSSVALGVKIAALGICQALKSQYSPSSPELSTKQDSSQPQHGLHLGKQKSLNGPKS